MSKQHAAPQGEDAAATQDPRGGAAPRRHHARTDDGRAFLPDPYGKEDVTSFESAGDASGDFAEELGESFIAGATGNVDLTEQTQERVDEAETGGPYVIVEGSEELALGTDAANPRDAEPEPFPSPMRG